jgi:hypothetical protein
MLYFITATPGSGKTLYVINKLKDIKDRKIYYHGIPELTLDWIELKDPVNYPDEITDGSIVVIDEVSDHFPVRSPKQSVPLGVEFIRKHRHRGIDIYFITQHPTLLDHQARRLVGNHVHLQRNFGLARAVMYQHNQLIDITNWHELQQCEKTQFKYPVDVYPLYKSAEVHTVQRKLPKKLLLFIPLLLLVFGGIYSVYNTLFSLDASGSSATSETPSSVDSSAVAGVNDSLFSTKKQSKKIDWLNDFVPAVAGLPHTAPAYQSIAKVTAMPIVVGCVSQSKQCKCYTSQGTPVDMSIDACFLRIAHTAFNPFLKEKRKNNRFSRSKSSSKPITSATASPTNNRYSF